MWLLNTADENSHFFKDEIPSMGAVLLYQMVFTKTPEKRVPKMPQLPTTSHPLWLRAVKEFEIYSKGVEYYSHMYNGCGKKLSENSAGFHFAQL